MSKHIWLSTRFRKTNPSVKTHTPTAMVLALEYGYSLQETCRFVGYYCERRRQDVGGKPVQITPRYKLHKAKNAAQYLGVGQRLVATYLAHYHPTYFGPDTVGAQLLTDLADAPLADWLVDQDTPTTLLGLVRPPHWPIIRQRFATLARADHPNVPAMYGRGVLLDVLCEGVQFSGDMSVLPTELEITWVWITGNIKPIYYVRSTIPQKGTT